MYNNSIVNVNRKTIIQSLGVVITVIFAIFIVTHGIMKIDTQSGSKLFNYTAINSDLSQGDTKKVAKFSITGSGNYAVTFPLDAGRTNLQYVNVPHFMIPVTVTPNHKALKVIVIGRRTLPQLALKNGTPLSWSSDGSQQPISQTSVDNSTTTSTSDVFYPQFETPFQVGSHLIGGLSAIDEETYLPLYYDISTGDNISFKAIGSSKVSSKKESTGFSAYNKQSGSITLYTPGSKSPKKTVTNNKDIVSFFNNTPLYTITPNTTAYIKGGDISSINENEEAEQTDADLELIIIKNSTSEIMKKKSFRHSQLRDISLAPDGKNLFIATNQSFVIYSVSDLKQVFYAPYNISQFLWVDNDRFAFQTTEDGLFIGSVSKKQASNIASGSDISPTSLSFVNNNELFFTAYSKHNPSSGNPDAYKVSLVDPPTNMDKIISKNTPHQGDGFYVDYINNRLIVQLTKYIYSSGESVSEEDKQRAIDFIDENIGKNHPPIEYIYIVTDLRNTASSEE